MKIELYCRCAALTWAVAGASQGVASAAGLAVPSLSSMPGASAQLYLDFDGEAAGTWLGTAVPATPAYSQDGDATAFTDGELTAVREIWARVAEKYAPFNVDVTTVRPAAFEDRQGLQVVVGGNGSWNGPQPGGGTSYEQGFFTPYLPNTVYVFSANLGNTPKFVGEAAAHEAGHAFGLAHQAVYSGGTLVHAYNPGDAARAPVMGNSYGSARGLWWNGTVGVAQTQDDLAVLSDLSTNGFGYRADDYGETTMTAGPLTVTGGAFNSAGIITTIADKDLFSLTVGSGALTVSVSPAAVGGMLDASLALLDASGALLASQKTASLGESLTATVAAGTYYVGVSSAQGYGDIGQYALSGTFVQAVPEPATALGTITLAAAALGRRRSGSRSR